MMKLLIFRSRKWECSILRCVAYRLRIHYNHIHSLFGDIQHYKLKNIVYASMDSLIIFSISIENTLKTLFRLTSHPILYLFYTQYLVVDHPLCSCLRKRKIKSSVDYFVWNPRNRFSYSIPTLTFIILYFNWKLHKNHIILILLRMIH